VNNLGKIAQSGTKKFAEALKESSSKGEGSVNLIGQFGVGFYSGFLVADKMTVYTKQADDDKVYVWESNAKNGFTVSETAASSEELLTLGGSSASSSSGTKIVLTLKEDTRTEYLDDYNLRNLLRKYSEFVNFPIELFTKTTTYNKEGNETKPIEKMEYQVVNSQEPLWLRSPKDVNQSEYAGFYKTAFRQFDEPLRSSHFALEGQVQFRALLFLPSVLPFELSRNMFDENLRNMKLYVKRVFINDQFGEDLLPRWLTFMKGLVDSEDLPLNVGREILQKSKVLTIIKKRLVRKSLDMFNDVARNGTDYETFWKNYGRYLKIGTVEEQGQIQKDIAKLCRFSSTKSDFTSFDELVARQKESHPEDTESTKRILFVSGEGKKAAESSPALERLKKENYEVLLLTEPLDELVMQAVGNFEGFTLVDAAKGDIFSSDAAAKGQDPFGGGPSDDDDPAWDPVKKVFSDALGKKNPEGLHVEAPHGLAGGSCPGGLRHVADDAALYERQRRRSRRRRPRLRRLGADHGTQPRPPRRQGPPDHQGSRHRAPHLRPRRAHLGLRRRRHRRLLETRQRTPRQTGRLPGGKDPRRRRRRTRHRTRSHRRLKLLTSLHNGGRKKNYKRESPHLLLKKSSHFNNQQQHIHSLTQRSPLPACLPACLRACSPPPTHTLFHTLTLSLFLRARAAPPCPTASSFRLSFFLSHPHSSIDGRRRSTPRPRRRRRPQTNPSN